jgi:hypothetical protein
MQPFAFGWIAIELAVRDDQPTRGALCRSLLGLSRLIRAVVSA